jgi:tryptophan-rich sensory protein
VKLKSVLRLVLCLALCLGVGLVNGRVTAAEIPGWYSTLVKPAGTPPNWVFPVIWNTLYVLMAISLWLLWDRTHASAARTAAIGLFLLHLALNGTWSPVFFQQHNVFAALLILIGMDLAVLVTIVAAWPIKRAASLLLMPYLAWITYATWLNAGLWMLNR